MHPGCFPTSPKVLERKILLAAERVYQKSLSTGQESLPTGQESLAAMEERNSLPDMLRQWLPCGRRGLGEAYFAGPAFSLLPCLVRQPHAEERSCLVWLRHPEAEFCLRRRSGTLPGAGRRGKEWREGSSVA